MLDGARQDAPSALREQFSHDETIELAVRREWLQRRLREALADLAQDARMCGFERSSLIFARAAVHLDLLRDFNNRSR